MQQSIVRCIHWQRLLLGWLAALLVASATALAGEPFDPRAMAEMAKRYHVPMPSADAQLRLVLISHHDNLSFYQPKYVAETASGDTLVQDGYKRQTITAQDQLEAKQSAASDGRVAPPWLRDATIEYGRIAAADFGLNSNDDTGLLCAVQAAVRGEDDLARALWREFISSEQHWLSRQTDLYDNPALLLASSLYFEAHEKLRLADSDWTSLWTRLKVLSDEFPELCRRNPFYADDARGLGEALKAPPAKPGSVEDLLVRWSQTNGAMEKGSPADEILMRGFDAVPELIALVGDRRLTRQMASRPNHLPEHIRLGGLAISLLSHWGCESKDVLDPDADLVQQWWKVARPAGERAALLPLVFARNDAQISYVHDVAVRLIARRHPECLAGLCEDLINLGEDLQPYYAGLFVAALSESSLPRADRQSLLEKISREGSCSLQLVVLGHLMDYDRETCRAALLNVFDHLPAAYVGGGPDGAALLQAVCRLNEEVVWKIYLDLGRDGEVEQRMRILEAIFGQLKEPQLPSVQKRIARFMEELLDDQTPLPDELIAMIPGSKVVTLGDGIVFAFMIEIDSDAKPQDDWATIDWDKARFAVRAKLKSMASGK